MQTSCVSGKQRKGLPVSATLAPSPADAHGGTHLLCAQPTGPLSESKDLGSLALSRFSSVKWGC